MDDDDRSVGLFDDVGHGCQSGDGLKCFKCDSANHLKKDCPQIPKAKVQLVWEAVLQGGRL